MKRVLGKLDSGKQETKAVESSPAPSNSCGFVYDVFLSFRGEDTRKGFTNHLYRALEKEGIHAFIDSVGLEKGGKIEELFSYIENSAVFVPIFSKRYAESGWCLKEIARIVECKRKILPVFFDVEPTDVKHQTGSFLNYFKEYLLTKEEKTLHDWKEALREAANCSGYDLVKNYNGDESKLIDDVVQELLREVSTTSLLHVAAYPVGMADCLSKMTEYLVRVDEVHKVCFIGIWGRGGLGKTSIAKATFNKFRLNFQHSAFLANVRERASNEDGLVQLQNTLMSSLFRGKSPRIDDKSAGIELMKRRTKGKRILVILDDVSTMEQVAHLVGDGCWLDEGSRIIITTRDKGLLKGLGIRNDAVYEPGTLNKDQAMELFAHFAFRRLLQPTDELVQLAKEIIMFIGTLPIALQVLGCHFATFETKNWRHLLKKLKQIAEAAKHLVGLDDHLCKMTGLLQMEVDHHHEEEVRFVGIWGIGGLGKTTIAKSTFDKFYLNFQCSVFLRNVSQIAAAQERSSGLVELQRRFLYGLFNDKYPNDFHDESDGIRLIRERTCGKKILVILDDVDHMNQLHCLVKDGSSWLGKGSRIIITTRDRGILSEQGLSDDAIYTPNKLNQDQAFELFCYFAFRRVKPTEEHDVQLAKDIIKSIGTLPLVLKVLGSDFSSIDMDHWRVRLESLKEVPHVDVQKTLQLSYDNLEYEQQQIFLDIACFFLGKYDENAMYMWEACNFQPKHSIEVLEQKLLVERNNNGWYHMHDEIRDMAREIIRLENQSKRWARSRVWTAKDALKAMMVKHCEEDSRNIRALLFNPNLQGAFTMGAMSAMSNMRMLIGDDFCHSLDSHRLRYDFQVAETPEEVLEITENIEDHQVPEPMWLRWCHYPFETMPQHALSFDQLVVLELPYFQGASLSFDTSGAKGLKNLKVLDLHSAKKLVSTPDFTLMPNLEKLILKDCSNLKDISPSIGVLQSLVELDLGGCEELKVLPLEIRHCFALKRLNADCCKTLRSLPIGIGTRRCSVSILQ